jgi:hypothetical protein
MEEVYGKEIGIYYLIIKKFYNIDSISFFFWIVDSIQSCLLSSVHTSLPFFVASPAVSLFMIWQTA